MSTGYAAAFGPAMRAALAEAGAALAMQPAEVPVGAVVLDSGGAIIGRGHNRREANADPTAHAEILAIRAAARELGTADLSGSTLHASCEPCPMCLAAALWARVDRLVHAATRHDAADAGFDDAEFHHQLRTQHVTDLVLEHAPHPARLTPFAAWEEQEDRIPY